MAHEPCLYKNYIKINLGVMIKKNQIFEVPIGNAKITRKLQFHPAETVMKYHQKTSNSCCLSSLASYFVLSMTTGM